MTIKYLILLMLALIIASLAKALYHLSRDTGDRGSVARALSWRVGLSVGVFVLLILAYYMGWIRPSR